jgi:hypothetical protein
MLSVRDILENALPGRRERQPGRIRASRSGADEFDGLSAGIELIGCNTVDSRAIVHSSREDGENTRRTTGRLSGCCRRSGSLRQRSR